MSRKSMSNTRALHNPVTTATQTTAVNFRFQFVGQLDSRGTIEVGKTADLVLLDKDPLADIHNTRSIQAVVINGRLFQRAALDAMLAKAQTLASREETGASEK